MKYDTSGQPSIAYVPGSIASSFKGTFVSSTGALTPPMAGGQALYRVERDCRISRVTLLGVGGTGTCVVDIRVCAYGSYPPTSLNSICGGVKPTISGGTQYENSTLSGWTRNLTAGDVIGINLDSSSTFTKVFCEVEVE